MTRSATRSWTKAISRAPSPASRDSPRHCRSSRQGRPQQRAMAGRPRGKPWQARPALCPHGRQGRGAAPVRARAGPRGAAAEKSGHQLWIGYLKSFDQEIAALEGPSPYEIKAAFEAENSPRRRRCKGNWRAQSRKPRRKRTARRDRLPRGSSTTFPGTGCSRANPGKALAASERALKLTPGELWIATNRAHALMFSAGRRRRARPISAIRGRRSRGRACGTGHPEGLRRVREARADASADGGDPAAARASREVNVIPCAAFGKVPDRPAAFWDGELREAPCREVARPCEP